MQFQRSSGVLLHVSSLPSYGGIGDLGPAAHRFVNFLAEAKQHLWQVLPLCPTGFGNSPYAGSSAFAGNPSLISLEFLSDWGWIAGERIANLAGRSGNVDFADVEARKLPLLYEAAGNFLDRGPHDEKMADQWRRFQQFCRAEASWLDDYVLYAELRRQFETGAWTAWPEPLRRREPQALAQAISENGRALGQERALQFAFSVQWVQLRSLAAHKAIRILGDIAIFVNMDSSDVWVHPELFDLDEDLKPVRIAGVPPDYFSPTGQRWGNPLYRWNVLEQRGFRLVDRPHPPRMPALRHRPPRPLPRLRGLLGDSRRRRDGGERRVGQSAGPGAFRGMEAALGPLPLVAEDLGVITPEVDALRKGLGLPGMKVLQFGFSAKGAHAHLPHRYTTDTVTYTGTHDNDTTLGWWQTATEIEQEAAESYLGVIPELQTPARKSSISKSSPVWPLIRAAEASVAQLALIPVQDLLELGSEARMNTPSVAAGNWSWRAPEDCWTPELAARLAAIVEVTDRDNDPLGEPEEAEAS